MNKKGKPYEHFAELYDEIMGGVDYQAWADYVETLLKKYNSSAKNIIDLGCGTASSTLPFAQRDYKIDGLDISSSMLSIAQQKAVEQGYSHIKLYEQDLLNITLPEKYDLALLFQDGLNYILTESDLANAFSNIKELLKPEGLFIFDLTRPSKRPHNEETSIYWVDQDHYTLIWESSYSRSSKIWSVNLTIFHRLENGLYDKYQERHAEKDHDPLLVEKLLRQAGFKILGCHPSFSLEDIAGGEAKLTFVAKKIRSHIN